MSKEKSENNARNIPVTIRLTEEEMEQERTNLQTA